MSKYAPSEEACRIAPEGLQYFGTGESWTLFGRLKINWWINMDGWVKGISERQDNG